MTRSTQRQGLVHLFTIMFGLTLSLFALVCNHTLAGTGVEGSGFSGPGVVNVKDFGALGDGLNADGYAIQAAIEAAEGGIVFLPKGTYRITETVVIPPEVKGTTLYGTGSSSLLAVDTAIDAIRVSALNAKLFNFDIQGNQVGRNGIVMHNAGRSVLEKVGVYNFTQNGILFDTAVAFPTGNNNLTKVLYTTTNLNGLAGIAMREHQLDNNGIEFIGVESRRNGTNGLLYKGQGCRVIGGIFEHNNSYGIQLSESSDRPYTSGCMIMYPWLEDNGRTVCAGQQARCGVLSAGKAVRNMIMRDITVQGLTSAPGSEDGEMTLANSYGAALQFRGANNRSINMHPLSNAPVVEIYPEGPDSALSLMLSGKNSGGVAIGRGGAPIQKHLSSVTQWIPPTLFSDSYATMEMPVAGATLGGTCTASLSSPLPEGVTLHAAVIATGAVRITLINHSKQVKQVPYGNLRVDVWVH